MPLTGMAQSTRTPPQPHGLSVWDARLIDVIMHCEDDVARYARLIDMAESGRLAAAHVLERCLENPCAHRHLALLTALHLVRERFDRAARQSADCAMPCGPAVDVLALETASRISGKHIVLLEAMIHTMFCHIARPAGPAGSTWCYDASMLARLTERRFVIAFEHAVSTLHRQFSCSLGTTLIAAVEPAMKAAQDKLTLRPALPLNVKAFAGSLLVVKHQQAHRPDAPVRLAELAADISQILRLPRTICLSA